MMYNIVLITTDGTSALYAERLTLDKVHEETQLLQKLMAKPLLILNVNGQMIVNTEIERMVVEVSKWLILVN